MQRATTRNSSKPSRKTLPCADLLVVPKKAHKKTHSSASGQTISSLRNVSGLVLDERFEIVKKIGTGG